MSQRIYNYCIHLLARQDYSEYKLRQKLRSKPQNLPHEIDEAVEKLKKNNLLKEESYRRLFIRKWMMKGESEDKIRKRGSREKLVFEEANSKSSLRNSASPTMTVSRSSFQKKLRSKEIPTDPKEKYKLRDKVLRFLISKGHSFQEARKVIDAQFNSSREVDSSSDHWE